MYMVLVMIVVCLHQVLLAVIVGTLVCSEL